IDGKTELSGNLIERDFRNLAITAALMRQQAMGVLDGAFASLDGDIHALGSLRGEPRGARYRDNAIVMDQHDIDAAWKQPRVDGKPLEQIRRLNRTLQNSRAVDTGTAQFERRTFRQAFDLQDQGRRTVGIFAGTERKAIQTGKRAGVADHGKAANRRIPDHWRAGVKFKPF